MATSVDAPVPTFDTRTSHSSTSSSSLASLPSPAPNHDALGLYDGTPHFEPTTFATTPSSAGFDKSFSFQPSFGYAQLIDGQSDTAPRQFKAPYIDVSHSSTFDPLMNPYGTPQPVFGFAQPQFTSMPFASSINPECLAKTTSNEDLDGPGSPLRSVSASESPLPSFDDYGGIKSRLRRTSEPTGFGTPEPRAKKHRRKMTWTPGMASEGPTVSQTQKERELSELSRLEQGGAATRRERRRLQNRLAQRAFRARSKVQNAEAATHLTDLEKLAEMQADQLRKMNEALENLQRENSQLKAESWAKANAERAHYNKGAGPGPEF